MARIIASTQDMARMRFAAAPAPLMETGLAIADLQRRPRDTLAPMGNPLPRHRPPTPGPHPRQRLRTTIPRPHGHRPRRSHRHGARHPTPLPPRRPHAVLDEPTRQTRPAAMGTQPRRRRPRKPRPRHPRPTRLPPDLRRSTMDPHIESFRHDVDSRLPILAREGFTGLFATLHPKMRFQDNAFVKTDSNRVVELGGDGLQLMPSAFWRGPPAFAIRPDIRGGNAMIYPANPIQPPGTTNPAPSPRPLPRRRTPRRPPRPHPRRRPARPTPAPHHHRPRRTTRDQPRLRLRTHPHPARSQPRPHHPARPLRPSQPHPTRPPATRRPPRPLTRPLTSTKLEVLPLKTWQSNSTTPSCKPRTARHPRPSSPNCSACPPPPNSGHSPIVAPSNDVSLDFMNTTARSPPSTTPSSSTTPNSTRSSAASPHRGITYWADPAHQEPGVINTRDGGRGCYFDDPNGHNLEILTRPYGSGD